MTMAMEGAGEFTWFGEGEKKALFGFGDGARLGWIGLVWLSLGGGVLWRTLLAFVELVLFGWRWTL